MVLAVLFGLVIVVMVLDVALLVYIPLAVLTFGKTIRVVVAE